MSGWIKLHRQFKENGHFNMPDRALKIWLYILMTVSYRDRPAIGLKAGEGWINYEMISEDCGEMGRAMRPEAIARELKWLEENGYIKRFIIRGKGQKITVPNWEKYQARGAETSETEVHPEELSKPTSETDAKAEVAPEVAPDPTSETQVAPEETPGEVTSETEAKAEDKQEVKERMKEREERSSTSSPDGQDDPPTAKGQIADLVAHYRQACVARPMQRDYAFMGRLYNTHPIDCIYEAIDATALQIAAGQQLDDPLRYVAGVLRNGVRPRDAPKRARPRETAVDRRLRALGVAFDAGA